MQRLLASLLACAPALAALPLLSNVFASHAVLQRDANMTLWGWTASPSLPVTVNISAPSISYFASYHTLSSSSGTPPWIWTVSLPPTAASFTPYSLSISSSDGAVAGATDVLFGDVFLCGGQSNQAIPLSYVFNASEEIAAAAAYSGSVRILRVANTQAASPSLNLTVSQAWTPVSASTIASFSALCWFTGKAIVDSGAITAGPVGLISSCVGGTAIQSWSSPTALQACNAPTGQTPSTLLFNGMIAPFMAAGVYPLTAITWMQGEQNTAQASYYTCGLSQLMTSWRQGFGLAPDAPFVVFQLAPWISEQDANGNDTQIGQLRLSQQVAVDGTPGAVLVSLIDLGDPTAPATSIHPRDKQHPGARAGAALQSVVYGNTSVQYRHPVYAGAVQSAAAGGSVTVQVSFDAAGVYDGLQLSPAWANPSALVCNTSAGLQPADCAAFEVQMCADSAWYAAPDVTLLNATAIALTASVNASSGGVVCATRFAFSSWPIVHVYNSARLPVLPWLQPL